ncbi:hypothetical protein [Dialister micraerophilus]|uniref:hypothetical protein n=1 Tax=Dialister micraerophilus TaxID=309120 RepID=UPI0023F33B66|nr:hypothetical protein [Dialister micraerophilus]
MALWNKTVVTSQGLELNARALTENKKIQIYEARGGHYENLKREAMPIRFEIAGKTSKGNTTHIVLQIDNNKVVEKLEFDTIALYAKLDGDVVTNALPYATVTTKDGEKEIIPPKTNQYKVLRVEVILAFDNTDNITVNPTINLGITKEESKLQAYDLLRTHNQDIDAHEPFYEKIKKFIKEQHFAPIDSPKFNGIPEVPLPSSYDSDNQVVNVAFLKSKLGTLDLGIMDGDVSNEKAWWVKIGGKIPLIIQGGEVPNHTWTYPIAMNKAISAQITRSDGGYEYTPIVDTLGSSSLHWWCVNNDNNEKYSHYGYALVIGI